MCPLSGALFLSGLRSAPFLTVPDLPLGVPMMKCRRCGGCRDTVKRVKTAWLGNTVPMTHYRWIVIPVAANSAAAKIAVIRPSYLALIAPKPQYHPGPGFLMLLLEMLLGVAG